MMNKKKAKLKYNHNSFDIIEDGDYVTCAVSGKEIELRGGNVITYLGSWKEHYKFWTIDNENLLIIKYEDLVKNIHQEINRMKIFKYFSIVLILFNFSLLNADEKKLETNGLSIPHFRS